MGIEEPEEQEGEGVKEGGITGRVVEEPEEVDGRVEVTSVVQAMDVSNEVDARVRDGVRQGDLGAGAVLAEEAVPVSEMLVEVTDFYNRADRAVPAPAELLDEVPVDKASEDSTAVVAPLNEQLDLTHFDNATIDTAHVLVEEPVPVSEMLVQVTDFYSRADRDVAPAPVEALTPIDGENGWVDDDETVPLARLSLSEPVAEPGQVSEMLREVTDFYKRDVARVEEPVVGAPLEEVGDSPVREEDGWVEETPLVVPSEPIGGVSELLREVTSFYTRAKDVPAPGVEGAKDDHAAVEEDEPKPVSEMLVEVTDFYRRDRSDVGVVEPTAPIETDPVVVRDLDDDVAVVKTDYLEFDRSNSTSTPADTDVAPEPHSTLPPPPESDDLVLDSPAPEDPLPRKRTLVEEPESFLSEPQPHVWPVRRPTRVRASRVPHRRGPSIFNGVEEPEEPETGVAEALEAPVAVVADRSFSTPGAAVDVLGAVERNVYGVEGEKVENVEKVEVEGGEKAGMYLQVVSTCGFLL